MAIGYQIALFLGGAGLLCLAAALLRLRAERRIQAGALRTVLVTGLAGRDAPRPRRDAIRMVPLTRAGPAPAGAARCALRRAYPG